MIMKEGLSREYLFEDTWNDYNYKVYEWDFDNYIFVGEIYCKSNDYKVIRRKWENLKLLG